MFSRFQKDVTQYYRYSLVSAKSQLKSEVANSYLNWIWWILNPLCFMLIYTFIFGYVFNSKEQYFSIFIFIGLSMWNFFDRTLRASVRMVKANKPIISRVYFPKYILLITKMWVNGFKMLVSFAIVLLMMVIFRVPVTWNILFALPILLVLYLLTFGCSCFLLHYGVYIEDLSNVIAIVMQMLFYITGIFYHVEKRIPQYGDWLNRYNPVAFLLTSMRQCMLYSQTPDLQILVFWLLISTILACLGICKIYKEENSYVKSI